MVEMTQQQLGDKVGIKFQQIQKYETGANRISASRMWDIAAVMEVPVSFFFDGLDGQAPDTGEARVDIFTDKETLDLVRAYYAIPENQRRGCSIWPACSARPPERPDYPGNSRWCVLWGGQDGA